MRVRPRPALGRLTKRAEFLAVARGRRRHADAITVQALPRSDEAGLRLGFTLTRKVGHATERNRIRRRLRAAAAEAGRAFAGSPLDVVIVGRREALSRPFGILVEDLSIAIGSLAAPRTRRSPDGVPRPGL